MALAPDADAERERIQSARLARRAERDRIILEVKLERRRKLDEANAIFENEELGEGNEGA